MSAPRGATSLLETLRVASGRVVRPERHRSRMESSAREFGWPFDPDAFDAALAGVLPAGDARIRVILSPDGEIQARFSNLPVRPAAVVLARASVRVRSDDPLCRHKVLPRGIYDAVRLKAESAGAWDGLLLNERGEVTETGRANILASIGRDMLTPPLACGVLPGTVRGGLLESGVLREGVLTPEDLTRAEGLFVTNALVGFAPVSCIPGLSYRPDPAVLSLRGNVLRAALE